MDYKAKKHENSSAKKLILGIAIAIVLAFFVNIGINVFYPSPSWNEFCERDRWNFPPYNESECIEQGGRWFAEENIRAPIPTYNDLHCTIIQEYENGTQELRCEPTGIIQEYISGQCNINYYCQQEFQKENENYNQIIFIVSLIIGTLIIGGGIILQSPTVASGLMGGGALILIVGIMRYWQYSTDILRFIILGIALAILIWLGYKKLND